MESFEILDVTQMPPVNRHPAIFEKFDRLGEDESFIIHNDYDTQPLFYQMLAEKGEVFEWKSLQKGPKIWEVLFRKNIAMAHEGIFRASGIKEDAYQDYLPEAWCAWD